MTKLAQPLLAHYHNPNPMLHLMGLDSTWLNTTLLDLIWRDLTRLDSTWRNLTRLDSTWRNLTRLIPPYWLPSLGKYLWWQKNGLAHEGKRERGHLLCSFLMSWDYFVVSVYPRTVCKCQEGTQGCPIYEPAASHHTHPQRTQWAKIYEKIREIATLVCNFMNAIIVDHISKNL